MLCKPTACVLPMTIESKIVSYSITYGVDPDTSLRIAFAESSFREKVINYNANGSNDMGVFQINSIHGVPDTCRLDADCNIEWAVKEIQKNGTGAWYSSKHKWYE